MNNEKSLGNDRGNETTGVTGCLTSAPEEDETQGPNAGEGEGEDAKRAARRLDQPHNKEAARTSDK